MPRVRPELKPLGIYDKGLCLIKNATMEFLFLGSVGLPEILVLALIVLLIFGGKKIPELMKGLGKGVRSFKDGMKGLDEGDEAEKASDEKASGQEKKERK